MVSGILGDSFIRKKPFYESDPSACVDRGYCVDDDGFVWEDCE
jgi:hypothetical protein